MKTKKQTLFLLFIIVCLGINPVIWSQNLIKSIPIEGKNLTNLSGSVNDSISFHIIINKIDNTYNSKAYFLDKDKVINTLELYDEAYKPNYLTFHVNDSTLTLVRETKDKKMVVQDVNYINRTTSYSNISFGAKQILSHENITFIIGKKMNMSYPFAFIKKASDTKIRFITPKNKIEESFFSSLENRAEFVNDK